jgi:hypothetical protein
VFLARHPDALPPPGPTVGPVADIAPRPSGTSPWLIAAVVIGAAIVLLLAAQALSLVR